MKKTISQPPNFVLGCALALLFFTGSGHAQTTTFTYQGSLIIGGAVANGSYDLQFKLYDQLSGGALQGSPSTMTVSSVTVTGGVFTVDLNFGATAFPGAARYLEISVRPAGSGSYTTLSPRQQLTSTPYAIRSLSAASADTATTATSATTATNATNFTGSLVGDVTGTQGATVVSLVGGVTASNIASGATAANNATNANTPSAIVKRDASGNFSAGTITASLNGNATTATSATTATTATTAANFSGSLAGDVTGTQNATAVSTVGGVTASNVASGATAANNATSANTPSTIVKRDASGNFSAGTITATGFSGSGANLTNLNASNITTGSLLDSLLSSNVAKLNTAQTFTANQTIAANLFQSGSLVQFTPTNGFVAGGTSGSGSIPATGAGVRMMWYPNKYAFRAGQALGTEWDDANVGQGSMALGSIVKASGPYSVAMGINSTASGAFSFAQGNGAIASGISSVAIGNGANSGGNTSFALGNSAIAGGNYAVAMGLQAFASGQSAVALGENNQASGNNSVALGRYASTGSRSGSFVFNDSSDTNLFSASTNNQFNVRATGGLRLFASSDTSDETKPGLFVSGTTGNTQINGDLTVSGTITGTVNANVASATNFTDSLAGEVTGTQSATVVSSVGGVTASNVASGTTLANNATSANTVSAIVKRDTAGDFSAGTITATGFSGSGASLTNLNASNITTGSLLDSLLSSNVAKLNTAQTFTANQTVSANLFQSGSLVQFTPTNGFVVRGTSGTGSIPATGAGVRMMWYPNKAAFRAGMAEGTEWDDANIGQYSMALGAFVKASGNSAVAMGSSSLATGDDSVAIGSSSLATGLTSVALGVGLTASGSGAVAMGNFSTASGNYSTALGANTEASGNFSTAMGHFASTNEKQGSFVYGDNSTNFSNVMKATASNQFNVRAAGGLRLFASSDTSDETKPGLFVSATTGNTQINGNLTVSGSISGTISGSGITNLNASNLVSGTLLDSLLSSNVAKLTGDQTFTGNKIFSGANGLLAMGTSGSGAIPATGAGVRMMWYPNKYAFRAGQASGTEWDDDNIGYGSVAFGDTAKASNFNSVAMGFGTTSSGISAVAMGNNVTASGNYAVGIGSQSTASGNNSVALGESNQASGNNSVALGRFASTNSKSGSFVFNDVASNNTLAATADNQFSVRATGGLRLFASTDTSDTTKPGLFISGVTGDTQINGNLAVSGAFSGSGLSLTSLNATNISSGTLADARLSSNVATLTGDQTFTGNKFFSGAKGLLATGTFGSGSIPTTGAGTRMMWYPGKAAFRAGFVNSTQWDDANVGNYSVAVGFNTTASNQFSFAGGDSTTASGNTSFSYGYNSTASGPYAFTLGANNTAACISCFALGTNAEATHSYSFVWGGGPSSVTSFAVNSVAWLATGGVRFYTNTAQTAGVSVAAGGGSWSSVSDRNLKENFQVVNPREILRGVLRLPISTWNYRAQDAEVRHIGPMAQDFFAVFKVGEDDKHIATIDPDGVALAAIQGLHEELKDRDARIERLEQQSKEQQALIDGLRKLLCAQNPRAEVCQQ